MRIIYYQNITTETDLDLHYISPLISEDRKFNFGDKLKDLLIFRFDKISFYFLSLKNFQSIFLVLILELKILKLFIQFFQAYSQFFFR